MNSGKSVTRASLPIVWRFAAFAVVFFTGLFACPIVAYSAHSYLPRLLSNWLFFWPQTALALNGFVAPASDMTRTFLSGGPNIVIAAIFWAVVGLALAWLLRHRRIVAIVLAALPVSFTVAWVMLLALRLMNVGIYLEGP